MRESGHQSGGWELENPILRPAQVWACHVHDREGGVRYPLISKCPFARHGLIPLRAQLRQGQEMAVGCQLHKALVLVPRSPTPRANCSIRPPMAPEGLGAGARSPTVLLYAAKKADRTSCSRVSRSLRAVSL